VVLTKIVAYSRESSGTYEFFKDMEKIMQQIFNHRNWCNVQAVGQTKGAGDISDWHMKPKK
jgi:hypothetical protein